MSTDERDKIYSGMKSKVCEWHVNARADETPSQEKKSKLCVSSFLSDMMNTSNSNNSSALPYAESEFDLYLQADLESSDPLEFWRSN